MSSSNKKRKNKWKSVAVEEILPNAVVRPITSWAEEVESELNEYTIKKISSINLPTAPRATCDLVIDETKIPPNGPFMAYLSNLPYEITEDDIGQQFKELKVANIQLPKDSRSDRMKGFGYVEFKDKSSLLTALNEGELTLKGRLVRISLPNDEEQNKDRGGRSGGVSFSRRDVSDRIDGSDRNLGEWRAAAPIPHDPDKGFTRPGQREGTGGPFREARAFDPEPSSSFSRGGGFRERDSGGFRERDSGGFRERDSGGFRERDGGGFRERDGGGFRERDGGGFRERERDRDFERSSDRGGNRLFGKRYDRDRDRDDRGGGGRMGFGRKFDREDREFRREPPPLDKEEPKSRPKLDIQPRTKPLEPNVTEGVPSSIFGGAKPVDTLKREMEIEAKLSNLATSQTVTRSRGSSPPPRSITPVSNRSRSSSVSSLSSCRRQDVDSVDNASESQQNVQSDDESKDHYRKSEPVDEPEFKQPPPPPPENYWKQRIAASSAATAESTVSDSSPSVIENPVYENSVDVNVENRSQNEDSSKRSVSSADEQSISADYKRSNETNARPTTDKDCNSDDGFTRYEPDHFNPGKSAPPSNRSGGGRYTDSKFNFNRDNRRDKGAWDNRARRSDNGQFRRDEHYNRSENTFGKWNPNRNRNNGPGGGRRFSDRDNRDNRDNGYYRDKHDSGSNFSNRSSCSSSTTNLRDDDTRNDRDRRRDERLIDDVSAEPTRRDEKVDERLKIVDDNANKKNIENGNENGVDSEDVVRKSNESIAINSEQSELNDNSFSSSKSRKKDRKKKNQEISEKDHEKQKNQKDDQKKTVDNHQVNDKANNKNNVKNKDNKSSKKNREVRRDIDDPSQMPKAKEEKAPNFQDSNRFLFLETDD